MKIKPLSDLHTEFNKDTPYVHNGEDVLLLLGDIITYRRTGDRLEEILEQVPENVQVYMVNGNHEFYGSVYDPKPLLIEKLEHDFPNFKLLDNEVDKIGDYVFYGGTMFTSLNQTFEDYVGVVQMQMSIGDFHEIKMNGGGRWLPTDHAAQFHRFLEGLKKVKSNISKNEKLIVLSHFIPKPDHTDPKFGINELTPYFVEDMTSHSDGVTAWFHGHGHMAFDTMHKGTRFVCNPYGYPRENYRGTGFDKYKIVEV